MSITIGGRLVDDAGNGINSATVSAIPVGGSSPDATTTTAAHPTTADDGWFEFTTLASTKSYKIQVSYAGRIREFYGLSEVQFDRVTIGQAKAVLDSTGKLTIAGTTTGDTMDLTNSDAAALGVQIKTTHASASPVQNDAIFRLTAQGKDSGGNTTEYARMTAFIDDPTDTTEDGYWLFSSQKAGSLANVAVLSPTATQLLSSTCYLGPNGSTNPALWVDGTTALAATGLIVTSKAAAAGLALSVSSSGTNENLTIDAKGSGTITLGATSTGGIVLARPVTLPGGTLLTTSAALTNGAAAATGTLTNAPTAGNPTKWIPINDNGTTRYFPAW